MRKIHIVPDEQELARTAAEEFCRVANEAVEARGVLRVALAGGTTPRALYRLLGGDGDRTFRARVPWDRTYFFFSDERHVPPNHADSNYRMAYETMLGRAPVPPGHVWRVGSEGPDVSQAADDYEFLIRESFRLQKGEIPRLDLILLGMGADGHTASLFPGSAALREPARLVAAPWVDSVKAYRFTLTPPVLNNAACVIFLVAGAAKAETLKKVLEGKPEPDRFPAQVVQPRDGALLWLVDRAAASLLKTP